MSRNQINFIIGAVCVFCSLLASLFSTSAAKKKRAWRPFQLPAPHPRPKPSRWPATPPHLLIPPHHQTTANLPNCSSAAFLAKAKNEVEAITGPATNALGDGYTTYNVDNCLVSAIYQNKQVQYIGVSLNPSCSVDLAAFGIANVRADDKLTFGQIETALGQNSLRKFQSSCLSHNCGNAADPRTYATYNIDANPEEPQALEIELEAVQLEAAGAAADQWRKPMMEQKGEEWLISEAYNCTDEYQALARELFQNIPVNTITIGLHNPSRVMPIGDPATCPAA